LREEVERNRIRNDSAGMISTCNVSAPLEIPRDDFKKVLQNFFTRDAVRQA